MNYSYLYRFIIIFGFIIFFENVVTEIIVDVERDAKLTPPEMISAYGYPAELHRVVTEDGYILDVHRIAAPGKQPVLLMHGMLDSSATWVMLGPDKGLGYILYDAGYDVWMANARGNVYSKGHLKYNSNGWRPERKKYWNFSWHEIGKYDLPAIINFLLAKTNFTRTHFIGHSQGCTTFFVMCSERPEYNEKILFMTAMAPAVFMGHVKNELLQLNVRHLDQIETISEWIGFYEFSKQANNLLVQTQHSVLCYFEVLKKTQLCNNNFSPLVGNITEHVNRSMIPVIETHAPADASMKQLFHFGHLIRYKRFCQYDFGAYRNQQIYGRRTPPNYNLKKCTVPVAIIYSERDTLAAADDVRLLPNALPNVVEIRRVDDDIFNHIDFIWASDAKELVYDYIIDWMKSMEMENSIELKSATTIVNGDDDDDDDDKIDATTPTESSTDA